MFFAGRGQCVVRCTIIILEALCTHDFINYWLAGISVFLLFFFSRENNYLHFHCGLIYGNGIACARGSHEAHSESIDLELVMRCYRPRDTGVNCYSRPM